MYFVGIPIRAHETRSRVTDKIKLQRQRGTERDDRQTVKKKRKDRVNPKVKETNTFFMLATPVLSGKRPCVRFELKQAIVPGYAKSKRSTDSKPVLDPKNLSDSNGLGTTDSDCKLIT